MLRIGKIFFFFTYRIGWENEIILHGVNYIYKISEVKLKKENARCVARKISTHGINTH
jgi:hypothetical protein